MILLRLLLCAIAEAPSEEQALGGAPGVSERVSKPGDCPADFHSGVSSVPERRACACCRSVPRDRSGC